MRNPHVILAIVDTSPADSTLMPDDRMQIERTAVGSQHRRQLVASRYR